MPPSSLPPDPAVIAADPTKPPFTPRPLISDILRTRYCIPGSIFLVEGVEAHILVSKRYRTVRLLLGDGELCIQALIHPDMHRFVDSGRVCVGCYLRLNRFDVRPIQLRTGQDQGPGPEAPTEMVVLAVMDMMTVGWNDAFRAMARLSWLLPEQAGQPMGPETGNDARLRDLCPPATTGRSLPTAHEAEGVPRPLRKTVPDEAVQVHQHDLDSAVTVSDQTADHRREEAAPFREHSSRFDADHTSWPSGGLAKPVKLTPLGSIPNLPYKQNWIVNILAIVASLSDVQPALLPGYVGKQRTARLADPSTHKRVLLTVFLDPDEFAPKVGGVVLLLAVKNHRFDGGSLKKYGNEKTRDRSRWWFENPTDVEWCDAEAMRNWWAKESS